MRIPGLRQAICLARQSLMATIDEEMTKSS
jgi:hypothetical protein